MKIEVNGEIIESESTTLDGLISELKIDIEGIAIAVGMDIIPQTSYGSHILKQGDEITIIRATKGG